MLWCKRMKLLPGKWFVTILLATILSGNGFGCAFFAALPVGQLSSAQAAVTLPSEVTLEEENNKFKFGNMQGELLKAYSINEINRYLTQMEPTEAVAALKWFRVMQMLKVKYVEDVSGPALLAGAIKGSVNALGDPYSVYMDPKMYKELTTDTKGSFGGIGIILGMKDNTPTVIAPVEGTPGAQAGILSGDHIIKIDGKATKDMALDEAVNMIRGPEGSSIVLTINRKGQDIGDITVVRANIKIKTVAGKMLPNNIGYIRLTMFNENTDEDLSKVLAELEEKGMVALVLDLRNNPGGLLDESVKVANHFVPSGPVVSVVPKDGNRQTHYSSLSAVKYPLAVLVNGGSASAAEIVAGAVQDTGAGLLIGEKTFGKGSVQQVVPLDKESAVKITIAHYYTPKNRSINGVGIEPDVKIEMPDFKEDGKDLQLDKAVELLQEKTGNIKKN